jgi:Ca-activated chloride channel family protein
MIRFAHPEYLYGLFLIPVLAGFFWLVARLRRSSLQRFGTLSVLARLTAEGSRAKRIWSAVLLTTAMALCILALANPQIGTRMEEVKQEGVDLFIALDVSLSMKAEDIKPHRLCGRCLHPVSADHRLRGRQPLSGRRRR